METSSEKKRFVLVVDDCSIDNFVNTKMILGYKFAESVQSFQNPIRALEFLRRAGSGENKEMPVPDVLFLDLEMPVMDGNAFLAEFASLPGPVRERCRIVVLSGLVDPANQATTIRNQFVIAQMHKPLIKNNLDQVDALLRDLDSPKWDVRKSA